MDAKLFSFYGMEKEKCKVFSVLRSFEWVVRMGKSRFGTTVENKSVYFTIYIWFFCKFVR